MLSFKRNLSFLFLSLALVLSLLSMHVSLDSEKRDTGIQAMESYVMIHVMM